MPECYNFAANYLLFGRIEKKINIQLKQKKKMKKYLMSMIQTRFTRRSVILWTATTRC